jgi:hypothetical protein
LKNDDLRKLALEVKNLESLFEEVVYTHVKRENPQMKKVDRMVNEAFEGRKG